MFQLCLINDINWRTCNQGHLYQGSYVASIVRVWKDPGGEERHTKGGIYIRTEQELLQLISAIHDLGPHLMIAPTNLKPRIITFFEGMRKMERRAMERFFRRWGDNEEIAAFQTSVDSVAGDADKVLLRMKVAENLQLLFGLTLISHLVHGG